jgi:two-component system sensor histidine kinase KdpD
VLNRVTRTGWRADVARALASVGGIASLTAVYLSWLHVTNPTTVALSFLLIILFVAASSRLWVAGVASVTAALALDFFFLPPVGTFNIDDPQDWIALFAFTTVSFVASHLSSVARGRELELGRLFEFSRDALLSIDADAIRSLAKHIAKQFRLEYVAICLPSGAGFDRHEAGTLGLQAMPSLDDLHRVADASTADKNNIVVTAIDGRDPVWLVPLRHRTQAMGVLAVAGRRIEGATLNALASVVAIAVERLRLLEQRERAETSRRSVEIKSALLASLAHDLRTPLTAARIAVTNLSVSTLTEVQRAGQVDVAMTGIERLTRLFQNILEMARIDAGEITPSFKWVHSSEIVRAARHQIEYALRAHEVRIVDHTNNRAVHVDPRLVSAALAHVLENAAQYSAPESTITVTLELVDGGLRLVVDDDGAGVAAADVPHLFERFYRGTAAQRHAPGTGMGLAIVQGLVNAQGGRVQVEDRPERGARFSIFVPAASRISLDDPETPSAQRSHRR